MLTMKPRRQSRISTKFVLLPLISILLMMLAASSSYAQSCTNCIQIPRADFELAKKAADEAAESRIVIQKQDREILLLRENSALKDELIKTLKEARDLQGQQLAKKDEEIAAEKTARQATEKQLTIETKEKEKAQRSAKFWKKVGAIAGGIAAALTYGALH